MRVTACAGWLALAVTSFAATPANWVEHNNPKGFLVKHPPGWVVETPEKDMVVIHDQTGGIQAIAMGFMTKADVTPQQWVQEFPNRFTDRFQKVRVDLAPQKRKEQAIAQIRYTSRYGDGRGTVLCWVNRGAGMMFAIATPAFRYDEFGPMLLQVLQTFTLTQPQGVANPNQQQAKQQATPNPLAGIQFGRWQDPAENAFSLELPVNWRKEGGTVRRSAADVHGYIRTTSDDGILVFSNDRDMTAFTVPTDTLTWTGFREGSRYSPGYGTQLTVMRYLPGVVFAEQWAQRVSGGAVQIRDKKSRDDLAAQVNALHQGGMAQINTTFGEVTFTTAKGQAGWILAGTQLISIAGSSLWHVDTLVGFIAPPDKAPTAVAAMGRMIQTYQLNPQWFAAQQQTIAQTTRIVAQTNDYVSRVITDSYWSRQKTLDRVNQNFSDYIRGVQPVVNPNTGEQYEAVAGHNYYYLPPGSVHPIGTDVQAPPNIDLVELYPIKR